MTLSRQFRCVLVVLSIARSRRVLRRATPAGEVLRSPPLETRRHPVEPDLFADPMPARVEPCLAFLRPRPPDGPDWLFEVKLATAWRCIATTGRAGHHPWRLRLTEHFPSVAAAAAERDAGSFLLDGEAVLLDQAGRADFGLLEQGSADAAAGAVPSRPGSTPSTCFISTGSTLGG